MTPDMELVLLFAGLHVVGLGVLATLLVMFFRAGTNRPWPPPGDDGGGGGGGTHGPSPAPGGGSPDGGLPLPDAVPTRFRLRDHTRLAELFPPAPRRPAREPEREPVSSSTRGRSDG